MPPSLTASTHPCSCHSIFTTYQRGLGQRSHWCPRRRPPAHQRRALAVTLPSPVSALPDARGPDVSAVRWKSIMGRAVHAGRPSRFRFHFSFIQKCRFEC
jgi:hypothetical protein